MTTVAMDIETDDLDAKEIWVICTEDVDTGEKDQFLKVTTNEAERERFIEFCKGVDRFVLHNGLGFDIPVINKLIQTDLITTDEVIDTLIVTRLADFTMDGKGHSLKVWGQRLGEAKTNYTAGFEELCQEMIDYCEQDVTVTIKLFNKFRDMIEDEQWHDAIRVEHDIQALCEEMTANGFYFDEDRAEELLGSVLTRMETLETGFQEDFPPVLNEVNRIKYRRKSNGELYSNVVKAQQSDRYFATALDKSVIPNDLVCFQYEAFNPRSPKQRIERLWDAGWNPYEKTKGHIEYDRESARTIRKW